MFSRHLAWLMVVLIGRGGASPIEARTVQPPADSGSLSTSAPSATGVTALSTPRTSAGDAAATQGWQEQVVAEMVQHEYEISWQEETVLHDVPGAWHAPNRAQGLRTYFT